MSWFITNQISAAKSETPQEVVAQWWGIPQFPGRYPRIRSFVAAAWRTLADHPGTVVTIAGTVAATGGILVAIGLVEQGTSVRPLENFWILVGLAFLAAGLILTASVFVSLMRHSGRTERHRVFLMYQTAQAIRLLIHIEDEGITNAASVERWHQINKELLNRIDPSAILLTRYHNPAGLPPYVANPNLNPEQNAWRRKLDTHLARLHEILAEVGP